MTNKIINLDELIGEHKLSGVDYGTILPNDDNHFWEAANTCTFILDNKTYIAVEDPSDGYRSSLAYLAEEDVEVKNTFVPHSVIGKYSDGTPDKAFVCEDILTLTDVITGREVLEIGTCDVDDYYPSFVANFNPQALAINTTVLNVIINSEHFEIANKSVTYEDLLRLIHQDPDRILTAVYHHNTLQGGSLRKGQNIQLREGMIFNIRDTSNA